MRACCQRLCLVACLLLAAIPSAHAALLSEFGQELALGTNLNGEGCRLRFVKSPPNDSDRRTYSLYCEGWTQSSGYLVSFKADSHFNPQGFLSKGSFAEQLTARLAECSPAADSKIADRLAGASRFCRRRDGGWPVVVSSTVADGRGYLFEMLPTNAPLAERAVDALVTDKGIVVKQAPRTALIQQFETQLSLSAVQFSVADIGTVQTLSRLGEEEIYAGRHAEAERAWSRVLELMEHAFGAQNPDNGRPLSFLALSIFWQGRNSQAEALYKRAEPLVQHAHNPDYYPEYLTFRSYLERRLGRGEAGLAMAQQSLALRRQLAQASAVKGGVPSPGWSRSIGHSALGLARAYIGLKRFKEAVEASQDSVDNFSRGFGDGHPLVGWAYVEQANAYEGLGDFAHAGEAATKAMQIHEALYGEGEAVFSDAALAGRVAMEGKHPDQALEDFRKAIRSAAASSSAELRATNWLGDYLDLLGAGGGGPAAAFDAAQLVRGGVTDAAIREMSARAAADQPELAVVVRTLQDARGKLIDLRTRIGEEQRKPPEERDPQEEPRLRAELAQAQADAAAAEERLQAQFPRYARLIQPSQVPSDEVNRLLHPDEALLLVMSAPASSYVFLVHGGQTRMVKAPLGLKELTAQITALRKTLDASETGVVPFDVATAQKLYEALLGPLAKELVGVKHLVFVSNGPLLSLPLGVLVRPGASAGSPNYLARDVAISVVPTVGAFRDLRKATAAAAAPKPFLGFGDPSFTGQAGDVRGVVAAAKDCRTEKPIDIAEIRGLPRLPETANELRGIAAALKASPDSVVLGPEATKAGLRSRDLAQYRVIAFATHGLLANELDCQNEPALALSLPAQATKGDDGLLQASEIVGLHLNADWILLSACNTAGPEGLAGEALSGLTRAFFYAGARSVMATHWPVESTATVRLTTLTFESFAKQPKRGRALALHDAQLALMSDPKTAHPVFWAPFVLVGDGG
jgi:CHAT domain-containing protein